MRPNIRIQIENDTSAMEVDDNEDGEIAESDGDEDQVSYKAVNEKDEKNLRIKLEERARRFKLPENERFESKILSLYHTLGVKSEDSPNYRFEAIHLHGIDRMNLLDMKKYFDNYRPTSIEWIDDSCCNVVFETRQMSTLAIIELSTPIRGVPVRDNIKFDESIDDSENSLDVEDTIDVSEISGYIPPGYWRCGKKQSKSGRVLMRFGLTSDKLPFKTEPFGSVRGSNPGTRPHGIFSRNKQMKSSSTSSSSNPWSILAEKWDEDSEFRERARWDEDEEPQALPAKIAPSLKGRLGKRKTGEDEVAKAETVRSKVPRMRMYADDEEAEVKKKKLLEKIDHQIDKIDAKPDLREILSSRSKSQQVSVRDRPILPTRRNDLVFEVRGEVIDRYEKAPSKVAVVVKKSIKPTVASTVHSRVGRINYHNDGDQTISEASEPEVDEDVEDSLEEEEFFAGATKKVTRPFFNASTTSRLTDKANPLKIEISNDRFLERN